MRERRKRGPSVEKECHHIRCPHCSHVSQYLVSEKATTVKCRSKFCGKDIGWHGHTIDDLEMIAAMILNLR